MGKYAGINNTMISSGQCAKILFLFALGSAALILPTAVTVIAKQDAWISMLLAGPINYFVVMIYLALADRFPNLTLAQYSEKVIGTWAGKAFTLTFVFFMLLLSALVLRNISDFITLSVLPLTPLWFINVTFMVVIIYGVYLGIETIARTGEIIFSWGMFVMTILVFALFSQFNFHNFEPFLYEGWMRPVKGIYPILGFPIGEFVFLTAILPLIKQEDRQKLRKHLKLSVVLISTMSILMVVFLLGVMGVYEASRSPFAIYDMVKYINIEEILVRVEVLVAVIWVGTVFMKLALCVYTLSVMSAQMLKLATYRPLVAPYAFIIVPLSMIVYRNNAHANHFAMEVWTVYSVFQGVVLPLGLLLVAVIRGKKDFSDGSFPEPKKVEKKAGGEKGAGGTSGGAAGGDPSPA
ncbi:endospore germination permease [Paenibacillus sp. N4]|uniref:GerAB/ArcD/ProY family transporter n=1 Tax=Paenibacillus vietnamensis TaxID=2590547 RepID=UPI001CD0E962|nr:endospore germination permease [Paenibacillus vietnamensis]MCA0758597.1 endospore germination permease [Paenibacillus vietnamensis]